MNGVSIYPGGNGWEDDYYRTCLGNMSGDSGGSVEHQDLGQVATDTSSAVHYVYEGPEGPGELYGDGPTGNFADRHPEGMSLQCTTMSS